MEVIEVIDTQIEVIQITEREVEVIEVIERGPQGEGIQALTTQGDIVYRGSSAVQRLAIGTAGQFLKVNTGATAPEWATITKSTVGLANVDNTSDANKPVSTATQTALDLKANIASPTFTGTVGGITKSMVGLGNVDNTSDANKPISTATQTALNGKANSNAGVPAGGTTGQVLRKVSNTNYDTEWGTGGVTYGTTAGTATEGNDSRIATIKPSSINTIDGEFGGGGTIDTHGADASGGYIHTYTNGSGSGGSIDTRGGNDAGGNILTYGINGVGGTIDTHGDDASGGRIDTHGGTAIGGSINTSDGGGSIDTRGVGYIELGNAGTRTTIVGGATTEDRTISLPDADGQVVLENTSPTFTGINVSSPSASPQIKLKGKTFFGDYSGSVGLLCESTSTFGDEPTFGFTGVNESVSGYKNIGFTGSGTPQLILNTNGCVAINHTFPTQFVDINGDLLLRESSNETKASYDGVAAGTANPVAIETLGTGIAGNSVVLDGFTGDPEDPVTINSKIADWNYNNPTNKVHLVSGDGEQLPNASASITLSGGTSASALFKASGNLTDYRIYDLPDVDGTLVTRGQIGISGDQSGSINLEGTSAAFGGSGGSIIANGSYDSTGGTLNMSGSQFGSGGSITTKDGGGSIDTRGNGTVAGGSIDTSLGGGSISTRGTGSIELGVTGTRTTLNGSASGSNKTITLPNATGTLSLTQQAGDYEVTDATKGVILKSPNNSRWRITIDNDGNLSSTKL